MANSMTCRVSAHSASATKPAAQSSTTRSVGRVREGQPGGLADLVSAQRLGLEPDQPGDPVGVVLQPVGRRSPSWKTMYSSLIALTAKS